ncbi:MAG: D-alanyl-D-alanine carboxypeptidase [Magnetospirillum sp.]|nr:D-alanyl-D-alanine carboxypeptidase [Magnetospirillum sp.]
MFIRLASVACVSLALGAVFPFHSARAAESRYASIIVDAEDGSILSQVNPDRRTYPASLTKIMTLFLVFDALETERLRLNTMLSVSKHAAAQSPSKLGLKPDSRITVEDAVLALVTRSANDAAVVVAEGIGGTEDGFAAMMTRKARALGMHQTVFQNASGLPDPDQVTTARDMATLARALIRTHGRYYHYFSTREFTYNGQAITTHNRLMLRYPGADGIKTGYIHASGFNLVSSAMRDGRRLIGVVFGGDTAGWRDRHMAQLLDKGFAQVSGYDVRSAAADQIGDDEEEAKMAAAPARPATRTATSVRMKVARAGRGRSDAVGDADPVSWGIQVGAYTSLKPAKSAAVAAMKKLGGLVAPATIDVDTAKAGKHTLYRARIVGFTEDQARAACKRLERAKKDCRVVNPNA